MAQTPRFSINGVESIQNISFPKVWDDLQGPTFALGAGVAAPALGDLSANAESTALTVRLQKFTPNTVDRVHFAMQVPHDVAVATWQGSSTGPVFMMPHVHWCLAPSTATISTGETVIWKMAYVGARGSTAEATAGRFSTRATYLVTQTWTTSSNADQAGKHFISKFISSGVTFNDAAASMFIVGTLSISSAATCTNACLLGLDWHYQKQPYGTVGEYSGY